MADLPDNYNLHYNLGGYVKYELSDNMSGTLVPRGRVGEQAHGISQFIFSSSGTFDLYKFGNSFLSGTNNATVEELEDEEIHTYLNTYVTGSGVLTSGTISNFFADDGEYKLVNIPGRHIVRSTPDYYEIASYDYYFTNKLAGIKISSGTVTVSGTLVNIVSDGAAESFDLITMLDQTGSTNVTLQNDNGELTVTGDMDITGDFTVAGTTYLQSVVTEVTDPILLLGAGTSASHTTDRGIEFKYYNGSVKSGFFGYNQDNERFVYLLDATNSSETITGTLGMIDVGGIYVSGSQKNNNWDTAYSWGDHSIAGYAASSHSHSIAHSSLTGIGTSDHHIRYTDTEAIDAIESLSTQSATSSDYVIFSGSSGLGKIAFSSLDENILTDIKTYVDNSVANSDTFAELNDVSVVPNENDFVVYSGSNWVDRTPAQVKDILGLGSTSSPTFDDVTITGTVTLSGDAIINETNATNDLTFQVGGNDVFTVTSDGITMSEVNGEQLDIEAGEFIGDLRGAIEFLAQVDESVGIDKGEVVYINGISGNTLTVGRADNNDTSRMPAFGIAAEDASNNSAITIYTFGTLTGLDTDPAGETWSEGDALYVSANRGELTNEKPSSEDNQIQKIARVTKVHDTTGSIFIMGAGRSNATPNLDDGNIFLGNASDYAVATTLDTSIVPESGNLYFTTARVDSHLSGGTGVTYSAGTISIGQDVATTADVTFDTIRLTSSGDASATSTTHAFQAGNTSTTNIIIDQNEVMARDNGVVSTLNFNPDGGDITFGVNNASTKMTFTSSSGDLDVKGDITVGGTVDGVDIATRDHDAVSLVTTSHDYLSLSGQAITLGAIDLAADVTGTLPIGSTDLDTGRLFPRTREVTSGDVNFRFRTGGSSAVNKEGISFSRFDAGYYGIFNDGSSTYGKLKIGYTAGNSDTTDLDSTTAVILIDRTSEVEINTATLDLNGALNVSGNIVVGGNVDGRDIATDGTKLDGIETGATADQTAADIRGLGFFDTTNDGTGSGLDADLLDGNEASAFATSGHTHAYLTQQDLDTHEADVDAHHAKYTDAEAVDAIEAVDTATPVSTDTLVFSDAGELKRVAFADLDNTILTGISTGGGGGSEASESAVDLASGWYTIAQNTGDRAIARFAIRDVNSGDHQSMVFYATHAFGTDGSNSITLLANSYYNDPPITQIRIKDGGTYDGAALQVYVDNNNDNNLTVYLLDTNIQSSGWVLVDWLTDSSAPSLVSNWSSFTEKAKITLTQLPEDGIITTGEIYGGGATTQYQYLNTADVDDTAVNGATTAPISSNWAFDHNANASAHHTKYSITEDSASDVTFDSLTLTQTTTAPLSIATGGGFEIDFTGSSSANIRNDGGSIFLLAGAGNAVALGSNGTNSILTVASDGDVDIANNLTVTDDIVIGSQGLENWSSSYSAIEIGATSIMGKDDSANDKDMYISTNAYFDSTWKRKTAEDTSQLYLLNREFVFRSAASSTADSAISWSTHAKIGSTSTFYGDVTVTKSSGDTTFIIEADSDNDTETDNVALELYQDGRIVYSKQGINDSNNSYYNYYQALLIQKQGNIKAKFDDNMIFFDNVYAYFGTDGDANIRWDSSNSRLDIRSDGDIQFIIDENNNSTNVFKIINGGSTNIFNLDESGNITNATWNGNVIASAYLDSDTAHLSGAQTFTGAKTFTSTVDINTTGTDAILTLTSTDDGSSAAPVIDLVRDSSSPASADYLGQIKFKGENSTGGSVVYSKITGKIDTETAGAEDGIIEFAVQRNSTQTIAMRLKHDKLLLANSTDLEVSGDAQIDGTITNATWNGDVIASAYLDSDTAHLSGAQTFTGSKTFSTNAKFYGNGGRPFEWGDTSALGALTFDGSANPMITSVGQDDLIFKTNNGGSEFFRLDHSANVILASKTISSTSSSPLTASASTSVIDLTASNNSGAKVAYLKMNVNEYRGAGMWITATNNNTNWWIGKAYTGSQFQIGFHDNASPQPEYSAQSLLSVTKAGLVTVANDFKIGTSTTVSSILDEDDMTSNSATALATQQSIKAYVDSQVASADQLSELSDVTLTSSSDGDLLRYNGSAWINTTTLNGTYTFTNDLTISKSVSTSLVSFFSLSDTSEDIFTIDAQDTKYGTGGTDIFLSNLQGSNNQRLVLVDGSNSTTDMFQLRYSTDGFSSVDNLVFSVTGDGDVETGGKYISDKGTATTGTFAEFKVDTDRVMSISYPIDDGGFEFDNNNYYVFKTDGGERLIIGDTFLRIPDSIELRLGQGNDFRFVHDGTNSSIVNYTGDIKIQQTVDDASILFQSDDGSGGINTYIDIDGSITKTVFAKPTRHGTNVQAWFGDSDNGYINWNGSYLKYEAPNLWLDANAGTIIIDATGDITMRDPTDNAEMFLLDTSARTLTIGDSGGNDDVDTTMYGNLTVADDLTVTGGVDSIKLNATGTNNSIKIQSAAGYWAYQRFQSNTGYFDIGVQNTNSSGAFQIRYNGSNNQASLFDSNGDLTLQNLAGGANRSVQLSIKANQYADGTTDYDTLMNFGINTGSTYAYGFLQAPADSSTSATETMRFYNTVTQFREKTLHLDDKPALFGSSSDSQIKWANSTNTLEIRSNGDITFTLDDNNDSANGFRINNGGDSTVFTVDESGNISNTAFTIPSSIGTSGQVLRVPSTGTTLEWATVSGGGGGGDVYLANTQTFTGENTFDEVINVGDGINKASGNLDFKIGDSWKFRVFDGGITVGGGRIDAVNQLNFNAVTSTIAGIENQNLLDKTASETITSTYNFQGANGGGAVEGIVIKNTSFTAGSKATLKLTSADQHAYISSNRTGANAGADLEFDVTDSSGVRQTGMIINEASDIKFLAGTYIGTTSGNSDHIRLLSSYVDFNRDAKFRNDVYINGGTDNSTARLYFQYDESGTDQFLMYRQSSDFNMDSSNSEPMNIRMGGTIVSKFTASAQYITYSSPLLSLETTDANNSIIQFRGDTDGTARDARIGLDYSDNMFRINHGSSFDGAHNGIQINSDGDVFLSNQLIVGDNSSPNSEAFVIQNSVSSASTPFARFKNTNNGGNSFMRFHALNAGGNDRYGDVGIDPDEGAIKIGFGVGSSTLPYGGDEQGVRIYQSGGMAFGKAGNGSNTGGRWFAIEGNTAGDGEGSGRIFFTEHNNTTASADYYGMSLGYRGGNTSTTTALGNSWTGLSQIGNGQWGMWGHNNNLAGALIMFGDRAATFVDFASNDIRNADLQTSVTWNSLTYDNVTDGLMYGSVNQELVPLIPVGTRDFGADNIRFQVDLELSSTNDWITYILPLPTNKGGLSLHVGEIYGSLTDADGSNYISEIKVYGNYTTSFTNTESDGTNRTSTGDFNTNFGGASDYGAYDQVTIYVNVVTNTSYALEINYLAAMCYYA